MRLTVTPSLAAELACVAVAVAFSAWIGLLALAHWLRKQFRAVSRELELRSDLAEKLNTITRELAEMQSRVEEIDQRASPLADWSSEPASVNLTRRGQVLRLHRRGESPGQIAAALGLSQAEVKLIIRVQEQAKTGANTEKAEEQPLKASGIFDTAYTEAGTRGRQIW